MSETAFVIVLTLAIFAIVVMTVCLLLYLHDGVAWVMNKLEGKMICLTKTGAEAYAPHVPNRAPSTSQCHVPQIARRYQRTASHAVTSAMSATRFHNQQERNI